MLITRLSLTNFRNYGRMELALPAGPLLLHGDNAQGKTNFLEAIFYLATSRSPQADQDQQLLNWDAAEADDPITVGRLIAHISVGGDPFPEERLIEMRLIRERQQGKVSFRREALVNRRKVRLMDLLGQLRVVLFLPQDINLITGPPAGRRRYLDMTLCQLDRSYCRALATYNKVLEQRNALLRQIAESGKGRDLLPIYTDRLVEHGGQLFSRRAQMLAGMARIAQRIHYEELTAKRETVKLGYLPRLEPAGSRAGENLADVEHLLQQAAWMQAATSTQIAERYQQQLHAAQPIDIAQARTTVGPHRDDWRFWVNRRALSRYGSRGQQRSAILALKLAEIQWIAAETGEHPILLLDEVAAELDESRRALLLDRVSQAPQAVVTATELSMFAPQFLRSATTIQVAHGRLSPPSAPELHADR